MKFKLLLIIFFINIGNCNIYLLLKMVLEPGGFLIIISMIFKTIRSCNVPENYAQYKIEGELF